MFQQDQDLAPDSDFPRTGSKITFPRVVELLEHVLLEVDHCDVVRATGVSRFWKSCIEGSPSLLRKIHRIATPLEKGAVPHFEELTEDSKDAKVPFFKFKGQSLWKVVRTSEDKYLDYVHEVIDELQDSDAKKRMEKMKEMEKMEKEYGNAAHDLRTGFMGVRIPNGWPIGLQELHCDICDQWHTNFRFENIHPLFRFLEDMTMCFRGNADQLFIRVAIVAQKTAPKECWEHSAEEALQWAKHLKKAYKALESRSTAAAFWSQPPVKKIVSNEGYIVECEEGLTLEKITTFLLHYYRQRLSKMRVRCHTYAHFKVTRRDATARDTRVAFPTPADWDKHIANFSQITSLWEQMIAEVDALMSDVAIWAPVLAEEVVLPMGHVTIDV